MKIGSFASRHMGPRLEDQNTMLSAIGCSSIDKLIAKTVPSAIRLRDPLDLPDNDYYEDRKEF